MAAEALGAWRANNLGAVYVTPEQIVWTALDKVESPVWKRSQDVWSVEVKYRIISSRA